jgi:Protein of unknown function (DUF4054)
MGYPLPTIDDFKTQFSGDFPFAVPGFGALGVATLVAGIVTGITLISGGQGYAQPPVVTLTSQPLDPGTGATATATIANGAVTGFVITNPGAGYIAAPSVSFSLGGGDDTNLKKVTDADIQLAIVKAKNVDDGSVWQLAETYKAAFLLATAHFLVQAVRSRFQGVRGQGGDWLVLGKSVGDVSANYAIPDRVQKSLRLAPFMRTDYGCQYLEMLSPYLFGAAFAAPACARN